jgi:hypothetical protein
MVPIYVFPEMKLRGLVTVFPKQDYNVSQFPHTCICERFNYSQDRSAYIAATKQAWQIDPGNI